MSRRSSSACRTTSRSRSNPRSCSPSWRGTAGRLRPSFDLAEALKYLAARDECLARLIDETRAFQLQIEEAEARSPYEALLESITYQSISGKAAATIFGRIKALGGNGRPPTPEAMLKLRKSVLRKAGLSGAKILAMKDLARKTLAGVVPSLEQAHEMSDEELVERLLPLP